ncbi:hypothetical protein PC117_g24244 [Phytophthora cactorum]|uniref:Retrotransposon gag domain-containing protein n=1 Tax=Phytophthora cactorum TaxID=29920 RepID=A0A8T1AVX4_9STRA|nr:hypothetical protein PC117_g24244 [Phytophthora cactorum]
MTGGGGGSSMIQRVRISAISDLKEFTGKDQDEDRARAWIGKAKSALMRDQESDAETCLTFADLLAGPARNWYRQLARSTQNKWPDLLWSFQTQYCGLGDPDLVDRLTLLRLPDADELEEVLRALDRAKHRHKKAVAGSNKFRQRAPAPMAPDRRVQKIQAADSGTESGSEESDSDPDSHPRICLAAGEDRASKSVDDQKRAEPSQRDRRLVDPAVGGRGAYRSRDHQDATDPIRCSQCGS